MHRLDDPNLSSRNSGASLPLLLAKEALACLHNALICFSRLSHFLSIKAQYTLAYLFEAFECQPLMESPT
ncbi:hypothetical protein BDW42DRAFT_182127 [Aspergillus taichungensis]|uniref:Uncharacterized protein n=1 Tax=Aspergillus taichungensis TaxID=482145 RepID=A0A2J5HCN5_9EURO|nr:hypothetical protein BDW42DRAFT_182127 [Aspergillus taichungensis]